MKGDFRIIYDSGHHLRGTAHSSDLFAATTGVFIDYSGYSGRAR